MSWLGSWLQNSIGTWLGSDEPEAAGAMRATLRGSSAVSGTLEGQGIPSTADMSATLSGSGSMSATIPVADGSLIGRAIRWIKPASKPANMSADLRGNSTFAPAAKCVVAISAVIAGSSALKFGISATVNAAVMLQGSSVLAGVAEAHTATEIVETEAVAPIKAYIGAELGGSGGLSGKVSVVYHLPTSSNDDDEMMMILLLAA